jgi:hypothetical protein
VRLGTLERLEPAVSLKRFERSAAIERLERLERTDPRDERSACPEHREASRRIAVEPFD